METMKEIILKNYDQYPQMQIEDFVKLIYQSHFGPKHMDSEPTYQQLLNFLNKEMEIDEFCAYSNPVEHIGGGYIRVYLDKLQISGMSVEELAKTLYDSMLEKTSPNNDDFKKDLDRLLMMIQQGEINLPFQSCRDFVFQYLMEGIRPIHHSSAYNQKYHPHYRVVSLKIRNSY